jgi:hypothetical protein
MKNFVAKTITMKKKNNNNNNFTKKFHRHRQMQINNLNREIVLSETITLLNMLI